MLRARSRGFPALLLVVLSRSTGAEDLKSIERMLVDGQLAQAEAGARTLLADAEGKQGSLSIEAGLALDLLVSVLWQAGKSAEPETASLARRAVAIKEQTRGPESRQAAASVINLAVVLCEAGDYAAALPAFDRARAILGREARPGDALLLKCLAAQAALYQAVGRLAEARKLFAGVLEDREKASPPDDSAVARALNNLAMVLVDMGEAPAALPLEQRALELWSRRLPPAHPSLGTGWNNLGWIAFQVGDLPMARSRLEQALEARRKNLGDAHPLTAFTAENLAIVLAEQGAEADLARALALEQQVLDVRKNALGPDHPLVARSHRYLAAALLQRGDMAGGLEQALSAEQIARAHARESTRTMAESDALSFRVAREQLSVKAAGLDLALAALARDPEARARARVLDAVIQSRGIVLDGLLHRKRNLEAGDPESERLSRELRAAATAYSNVRVRGSGAEGAAVPLQLLQTLRRRLDDAERALAAQSARFRRQLDVESIGLSRVARALPPGSALLSFVSGGDAPGTYAAFVLRAGETEPAFFALGERVTIDAAVSAWNETLGAVSPDRDEARAAGALSRARGLELRQLIWDPLAAALENVDSVYLVADGALHTVSFAALPEPVSGYLVEKGPLLCGLATERDLIAFVGRDRATSGLLVVGGPDFDAAPEPVVTGQARPGQTAASSLQALTGGCEDFRTLRFAPLPKSALEAEEAAELWRHQGPAQGEVVLLRGAQAEEKAVKALAPGRRVIHLATHALYLSEPCLRSALGTRGISRLKRTALRDTQESPPEREALLGLCGLALSGANQRLQAPEGAEDGILTSEEVAAQDLSGVELVVLSACETGAGRVVSGEGVVGLRRAFQIAGARSTVSSLWPVDDSATRAWMKELYAACARRGWQAAQAVHDADLQILEARRAAGESDHPFFWAAFVSHGS